MLEQNKKIFFFIIILIIIFILFGFLFYTNNKKNSIKTKKIDNQKIDDQKVDNQLVSEKIIKFKEKRPGSIVANVIFKDDCNDMVGEIKEDCLNEAIRNEANIANNFRMCLGVTDYDIRNKCIFEMAKFTTKKNCERIADHKLAEVCIGDIGINNRDESYCNVFLEEPHEYEECVDRIKAFSVGDSGDINDCIGIKTLEYVNLCMMRSLGNGTTCNDLKNKNLMDECISSVIFRQATSSEDCYKMPDEIYKEVCLLKDPEGERVDTDGDGFTDVKELWFNTDPFNIDTDGDGFTDYEEVINIHSNPTEKDTDYDGLSDYDEIQKGTSIQRPDTDGDGILDGEDDDPLNKFQDNDEDRLSNEEEKKWGTDPNKKDTDGDGVNDRDEVSNGTNPLGEGWAHDTDNDGLIDIDEIFYLTDRLNQDTDGDGVNDRDEINNGTNPLGEGDMDFDDDGLSDKEELKYKSNPTLKDTNADGINDSEAIKRGLSIISNDTDGDGLNNDFEIQKIKTDPLNPDTDGDGYSDGEEAKNGYNPNGAGKLNI
ncbi:hypothetical protein HOD96_02850 [Candidatus Falkowbacteria bacterium]|jgi:hypothetical protein|nr:hypothetical protein [Candidatus Falkowbacteria bacterium]